MRAHVQKFQQSSIIQFYSNQTIILINYCLFIVCLLIVYFWPVTLSSCQLACLLVIEFDEDLKK